MSAFEKLPIEIQDLIFEHCLLYRGEIIPFPRDNERVGRDRYPALSELDATRLGPMFSQKDGRDPFVGYPNVKRYARQTEEGPCIALLRVNSRIREEAAKILFGKNIWRLSSMSYVRDDRYRWWETYAQYFRHVVTKFDAHDLNEAKLLDIKKKEIGRVEDDSEDYDHFDQIGFVGIHQEELSLLIDGFTAKRDILRRMNLKSLMLDFSELYCLHLCCRYEAFQSCLTCLGSIGPWYRLEPERERDLETSPETDVRVLGLTDGKEETLMWDTWGLKPTIKPSHRSYWLSFKHSLEGQVLQLLHHRSITGHYN